MKILYKRIYESFLKEKIINLLKKGYNIDRILDLIKVGSYNSLHHYIKTRNLREEAKLQIIKEKVIN